MLRNTHLQLALVLIFLFNGALTTSASISSNSTLAPHIQKKLTPEELLQSKITKISRKSGQHTSVLDTILSDVIIEKKIISTTVFYANMKENINVSEERLE